MIHYTPGETILGKTILEENDPEADVDCFTIDKDDSSAHGELHQGMICVYFDESLRDRIVQLLNDNPIIPEEETDVHLLVRTNVSENYEINTLYMLDQVMNHAMDRIDEDAMERIGTWFGDRYKEVSS
jgi:hypothetical protein